MYFKQGYNYLATQLVVAIEFLLSKLLPWFTHEQVSGCEPQE